MNSYCYECKKKAPKGKINLDCLACMHMVCIHKTTIKKRQLYF